MKKILAIALAILMVLSFAACGSENTGSESGNGANQQTNADAGKTDPAGDKTDASAEHPVLKLCGLTVEDIRAGVGTALGETVIETESQFMCSVTCPEASFSDFESWVNALADNCRKAAKDGKLYESEMSGEECTSFSLDPNALMNVVQFIYRKGGNVIYVNASYAVTGNNAFGCNIQVY